jgi:hypothetical protein
VIGAAETPAQLLLQLLEQLLAGDAPELHDIMFLKSALMRSVDFYQPLNLRGHIKQSNLDVSGPPHPVSSRVSDSTCWGRC